MLWQGDLEFLSSISDELSKQWSKHELSPNEPNELHQPNEWLQSKVTLISFLSILPIDINSCLCSNGHS